MATESRQRITLERKTGFHFALNHNGKHSAKEGCLSFELFDGCVVSLTYDIRRDRAVPPIRCHHHSGRRRAAKIS